jgi:hypothetical protein
MNPGTETEAVAAGQEVGGSLLRSRAMTGGGGKRWAERNGDVGKGGQKVGKWSGFSHLETTLTRLFPHILTQVVDFPRMYVVRVFSGGLKFGFASQAVHGSRWVRQRARRVVRNYARELSAFIGLFHVLSDIIAHGRAVLSHFLAFYRLEPFFEEEAKK